MVSASPTVLARSCCWCVLGLVVKTRASRPRARGPTAWCASRDAYPPRPARDDPAIRGLASFFFLFFLSFFFCACFVGLTDSPCLPLRLVCGPHPTAPRTSRHLQLHSRCFYVWDPKRFQRPRRQSRRSPLAPTDDLMGSPDSTRIRTAHLQGIG